MKKSKRKKTTAPAPSKDATYKVAQIKQPKKRPSINDIINAPVKRNAPPLASTTFDGILCTTTESKKDTPHFGPVKPSVKIVNPTSSDIESQLASLDSITIHNPLE